MGTVQVIVLSIEHLQYEDKVGKINLSKDGSYVGPSVHLQSKLLAMRL